MFLRSEMHTDALLVPLSLFCSLTQQTASSLPLHLVRSDLQSSALAPLFHNFRRKQLMQMFPGLGWVFCFARGKPQVSSDCVFATCFSSDGAYGCCLVLARIFFICACLYIGLDVRCCADLISI